MLELLHSDTKGWKSFVWAVRLGAVVESNIRLYKESAGHLTVESSSICARLFT